MRNMALEDDGYLKDARLVYKQVNKQIRLIKKSLDKLRNLKTYRGVLLKKKNISQVACDRLFDDKILQLRSKLLKELTNCRVKTTALEYLFTLSRPSQTNLTLAAHQRDIISCLFGGSKSKSNRKLNRAANNKTKNLAELTYHRTLWDIFLHIHGSPLPQTWILPPVNSSEQWKKYLIK